MGAAGVLVPAARRGRGPARARWTTPSASATLELATADGRHPLLAFGSNGAPERLALKFTDCRDDERELLVLAGDLHDFDVGAAPMPTFYGSLPGDDLPQPRRRGARVAAVGQRRAADGARMERAELLPRASRRRALRARRGLLRSTGVLGFVSRWGALCLDEQIVAMAAVPATRREARR